MPEDNKPPVKTKTGLIFIIAMVIWSGLLLGLIFLAWINYLDPRLQDLSARMNQQDALQQNLQEEISSLAKSVNNSSQKNLMEQLGFILQMANLQITVNHNTQATLALLQQIDLNPRVNSDPAFSEFKNALSQDIEQLKAAETVNIPAIIEKLDHLNSEIQNLPTHNRSFPPERNATVSSKTLAASPASHPWYQNYLEALSSLKELVIIRHTSETMRPLLTSEEELYIKENIQTKILQAEWAVLHQEPELYQSSLNQIKQWLTRYFTTIPNLKFILNNIALLQSINLKNESLTITRSTQAFNRMSDTSLPTPPSIRPPKPLNKQPPQQPKTHPETLI